MLPKAPKKASKNRAVAVALFFVLILAALIEEHRNGTISSGVVSSGMTFKRGYNALGGGGGERRRKAHVVLVDNRDLATERSYGYYTMAMWKLYSSIVPDVGLFVYNSSTLCPEGELGYGFNVTCEGYNGTRMSPYWMKVLAVLTAMDEANEDDLLLFMDTDMQIMPENFTTSIFDLDEIQTFLQSGKSMLVIKEDGSFWGWGTEEIFKPDDIGKAVTRLYRAPIVSNFFVVINNDIGRRMMEIWWQSMAHSTKMDPTGESFLWGWPWEQERIAAYYDAAPVLFYSVEQTWIYFSWLHHGPFCCVGFESKFDIIRSVNETMMHQVRANNISRWNDTGFDELADDLYRQIRIRPLSRMDFRPVSMTEPGMAMHNLTYFWNASSPPYFSQSRKAHVVLVDNRDLATERSYGYYTMAMWKLYSSIVPDVGLFVYNSSTLCPEGELGYGFNVTCEGYNGTRMSPYWMKVLAVLTAMDEANEDDLLLFMDTDMQIMPENFTTSIFDLDEIQTFLQSGKSMLVIKEDGSFWGWGTEEIFKPDDIGKAVTRLYRAPIVSNFFVVINNDIGRRMMEIWWQSMAHSTKMDPTGESFLWGWPWEQERIAAYYDAAPDLFYPVEQSWIYFSSSWIRHGSIECCFEEKHQIIQDMNKTLPYQVRVYNISRWNDSDFEELVSGLYHQIPIRQLFNKEFRPVVENEPGLELHNLTYFWNASSPPFYSFSNDSSPT